MTKDEVFKGLLMLVDAAYDLGFSQSAEGWNGECGAEDRLKEEFYRNRRRNKIYSELHEVIDTYLLAVNASLKDG